MFRLLSKTFKKISADQSGVAILLAMVLIGFVISMAITLAALFTPKIRLASEVRNSVGAFYAADSGLERCLYVSSKGATGALNMSNGATVVVTPPDCSSSTIRSVGSYGGVTRAVEISF